MAGNTKTKKKDDAVYVITGKELPICVKLPSGGELVYSEEGEEFAASDWPNPAVSIPNAIAYGLIRKQV